MPSKISDEASTLVRKGHPVGENDFDPPAIHVDTRAPSIARVYDYLLGGSANFEVDRHFAERLIARHPLVRDMALANRLFLGRAIRHLVKNGVRQFVDIGAGVPTMGNTHQVAAAADERCRVVYLDNEPVAVAYAHSLLEREGGDSKYAVVNADLRAPRTLWDTVEWTGIIDPDEPVAILLIAILHVQQRGAENRDIGAECVAELRKLLAPGSYLVLSHATDDGVPDLVAEELADIKEMYANAGSPVIWRTRDEIRELFGDFGLLEPGLCWTPEWHPEEAIEDDRSAALPAPNQSVALAGIGKKPNV